MESFVAFSKLGMITLIDSKYQPRRLVLKKLRKFISELFDIFIREAEPECIKAIAKLIVFLFLLFNGFSQFFIGSTLGKHLFQILNIRFDVSFFLRF